MTWEEVWDKYRTFKNICDMIFALELEEYKKNKYDAQRAFVQSIVDYIRQELSTTDERAWRIYTFCYNEKHSESWKAVLEFVEELLIVLAED